MKNKQIMALMAFGIISILGVSVMAYQGNPDVKGPNYSEERHVAIAESFENLDYASWVALMSEDGRHSKVLDLVTEENFATFVSMHNAMISVDKDTANALREELGLSQGRMSGNAGEGRGNGSGQMNKGSGQMNKGSGRMGGHNGDCPYAE